VTAAAVFGVSRRRRRRRRRGCIRRHGQILRGRFSCVGVRYKIPKGSRQVSTRLTKKFGRKIRLQGGLSMTTFAGSRGTRDWPSSVVVVDFLCFAQ